MVVKKVDLCPLSEAISIMIQLITPSLQYLGVYPSDLCLPPCASSCTVEHTHQLGREHVLPCQWCHLILNTFFGFQPSTRWWIIIISVLGQIAAGSAVGLKAAGSSVG